MVQFPREKPFVIKKKIGTIRKKEIEYTVVPYSMVSPRSTLKKLSEELAKRLGASEYRIREILDHTHTPKVLAKKENSESYEVIAPSTDDAFLYHIFFQLLALPIALKNKKIKENHLANATAKVIHTHALNGKVYAIAGEVEPEDLEHPRINGYLTKKFDETITEDNIPKLAKTWVEGLREAGVYGISEEEVEQYMRKARELAKKIKKELHGNYIDPRDLKTENPMIWLALDVEEFRQFLAEISGKKTIPQEPHPRAKTAGELSSVASSLTLAARELLGLLSGLRLAGYSEGALENLRRELEKRIDGLIENPGENLELIGLYTAVLKLAEKGEIEKAEEFLRGL